MRIGRLALVGVALLSGQAGAGDDPVLKTEQEKLSYAMGVGMAQGLKRQGVEVDGDLLTRGLRDGLSGRKLLLTDDELRQTMTAFQVDQKQKQAQQSAKTTEAQPAKTPAEAKKQGEAFLAENAKKEGVVTLPSGLQYKVLRAGDGKKPTDGDQVVCHYRGSFVDGTEFDSSYRRGRPATLDLARVIPGWSEALKLMPAGSKWQLFIPAKLAYGERGMPGRKRKPGIIGPNATLIYETELLDVKSASGGPDTRTAAKPSGPTGD
ncbi:MAG TPA: FKBP-type peptidyl-prolyl cis-trans isomerase [Anaeromyxobacteraceae bacterium]|nr:FKBP-type peptidyl-prolyl cis-trans isomerase [Anaeromyxobacteraceae bacterium]